MKLEQQVCSLELAKRLKELGVKQDSAFYWVSFEAHDYILNQEVPGSLKERNFLLPSDDSRLKNYPAFSNNFSAFTVAELGEILPFGFDSHKVEEHTNLGWMARYTDYRFFAATEADARAKMLIHLIEREGMRTATPEAFNKGQEEA